MPFPFVLHELAHNEFVEAFGWYEDKQKGLGDRFINNTEKRLKQISEHPEHYGHKQNSKFREVKIDGFPYMIVYEFFKRKQLIHIAAIYHFKRKTTRKYRRLK